MKMKDLVGIPWMVAFALRADGWYLRSDIIWAKGRSFDPDGSGSCMPESVRDRPTRGHEYVFLLTKQAKYFYDAEAVKEQGTIPAGTQGAKGSGQREGNRRGGYAHAKADGFADVRTEQGYWSYSGKRNLRSVWVINPQPFSGAHFATFPEKLVEPCLLAGSAHWQTDHARSVVLDPFCGSGTVGVVAQRHGRYFLGCDLNPEYLAMARQRIG
jgi:DNA modification methylase